MKKQFADKSTLMDVLQKTLDNRRAKKESPLQNKYNADQKLVLFTLQQTGVLTFIPPQSEKKVIDEIRLRHALEHKKDRNKTLIATALEVSNEVNRAHLDKMTSRTIAMYAFIKD